MPVSIEEFGGPKRPQCPYFLWMNDNRGKIQADLGTKNIPQIAKEAGERWRSISATEKSKYEDEAAKAKGEYEKKMAEFENSPKHAEWKAAVKEAKKKGEKVPGSRKREREEGQPKRPQSAFFLWMNMTGREDLKKENPNASVAELAKLAGEAWGKMTPAERKPWETRVAKATTEYQKAMEEFKAKNCSG
eukprot:Hpha_TRINITY_DN16511_c2_g1::TRINITY_DN16511_c2_g1_i1::g.133924::m.133924/K11295/HMGB2; high mobility group protein B2